MTLKASWAAVCPRMSIPTRPRRGKERGTQIQFLLTMCERCRVQIRITTIILKVMTITLTLMGYPQKMKRWTLISPTPKCTRTLSSTKELTLSKRSRMSRSKSPMKTGSRILSPVSSRWRTLNRTTKTLWRKSAAFKIWKRAQALVAGSAADRAKCQTWNQITSRAKIMK